VIKRFKRFYLMLPTLWHKLRLFFANVKIFSSQVRTEES
jgi:hypothetical protein